MTEVEDFRSTCIAAVATGRLSGASGIERVAKISKM